MPSSSVSTPTEVPRRADRSHWLVWLVLVSSLLFGMFSWALTRHELRKLDLGRFERISQRTTSSISSRFDAVGDLLHAARGLYLSSDSVTPPEWSTYLRSLSPRLGPGVTGLGYIKRVPRSGAADFVAFMHANGYPAYQLENIGHYPWHYAVVLIEPAETNTDVAGLDIASGEKRRTAAETAARDDILTLSRRIRLNFEGREVPGSLLLLPIFQKGADLTTPEQRLIALEGWVYASIRIDLLMQGLGTYVGNQIDFEIFEGHDTTMDSLLYDADGHLGTEHNRPVSEADFKGREFNSVVPLTIHGQPWLIRLSTRPEFDQQSNLWLPWVALTGWLTFGLFSAALIRATTRARTKAVILAEQMTVDLRRSEAEASKLALVASLTTNIVVLTDSDWRITWVNDGFTRILGYTLPEALGQRPNDFLRSPQTDRATLIAMVRAGRVGESFRGEVALRTKTGETLWVDMELQPVRDAHGTITGYMSVQQDITARKQAATELLAAKLAAEQANVAKSQFLATMSHEIRTPMNGVIGMTSLLLDSPLTAEQRSFAETIRVSGDSLLVIINDILDFSKIESGRLELEEIPFSVRECVEGALDLLAGRAAEKHLDLLYEIDDSTPGQVTGDPTRLRQILVNLLSNAVKFTERGEVHLKLRASSAENEGVLLEFSIRDTGIGIPPEAQDKLFQSFTQVDASTTRKFGGTGLGLAISKRLAELMGGRMWLESEPGRGTTFFFTILGGNAGSKPRLFVSENTVNLAGRRVLLVDDNPMNLRILASLATKWGLHAQEAASGREALALLQGGVVFDAAILDMHMPDMDGAALAAAMHQNTGANTPPLILLSSLGQREHVPQPAHFAAFLTKPAKPAQLHHALTRVFSQSAAPAPVPAKPAAPAPANGSFCLISRVLIAEDHTVNQRVAILMLERLGYRPDLAADGHEVLAAVKRQPYDIILMDVQMPGMDGLETTRELIKRYPDPLTRPWIIALTAGAMEGDRDRCLEAGMDDFITKPIKHADLAAAMSRARPRTRR